MSYDCAFQLIPVNEVDRKTKQITWTAAVNVRISFDLGPALDIKFQSKTFNFLTEKEFSPTT